jgi:DNA polymerase I-like protein with 3'-5' exonuclease and polymerase domains
MWDVYCHTWLPFGGLLTDMEAVGMAVDRQHLAAAQQQAETDQQQAQERFRWVGSRGRSRGRGVCSRPAL